MFSAGKWIRLREKSIPVQKKCAGFFYVSDEIR